MPLNIPILLTWLRIILIPLLIAVYYLPEAWFEGIGRDVSATLIFVVAAVTDWLDGYLARRWQQTSAFRRLSRPGG
jgi:phosphatidylglycerophosphate synthase